MFFIFASVFLKKFEKILKKCKLTMKNVKKYDEKRAF